LVSVSLSRRALLICNVTLTRPREKAEGRKKETSPQREGGRMEGRKKGAGKQKGKVKQTEKLSS
jgi:hypothetical protein